MTSPATGMPNRLPHARSDAGKSSGRTVTGDTPDGFKMALSRAENEAMGRDKASASATNAPGSEHSLMIGAEGASDELAAPLDPTQSGTQRTGHQAGDESTIAAAHELEAEAAGGIFAAGDDRDAGATANHALQHLAAVFASAGPTERVPDTSAAAGNDGASAVFGKGAAAAVRFVLERAEELRSTQSALTGGSAGGAADGSRGPAIAAAVSAATAPGTTASIAETAIGADKASPGLPPALPGAVTPAQTPSVTVLRQETHLPPVTQVAEQVVEMIEAAGGKLSAPKDATRILELQLRPAELGTVRISLRFNDGRLEVELRTERTETGQMLERDRPRLAKALANAGYQTDSVAVSSIGERPHVRVAAGPQLSPGLAGDFNGALGGGAASGGHSSGNGDDEAMPFTREGTGPGDVNDAERIDNGQAHDRDGLYL